jgi:hypothetical protein
MKRSTIVAILSTAAVATAVLVLWARSDAFASLVAGRQIGGVGSVSV